MLLYILLLSNVFLRVFTNKYNFLPRIFNISDVFLVSLLLLFYIINKSGNNIKKYNINVLRYLFVFNVIMCFAIMLNSKYFYPPAALSQIVMWNEPIILFYIVGLQLRYN